MSGTYILLPSGGSAYWDDSVASASLLPSGGKATGSVILVRDTLALVYWDGAAWSTVFPGSATNVVGPGSSTDNRVVRWDGATGTAVQSSTAALTDAGALSGLTDVTATGTVAAAGITKTGGGSGPARLAVGVLTTGVTDINTETTGTLAVAAGGTNSAATLNNGKVMRSAAGAIVESSVTDDGAGAIGCASVTASGAVAAATVAASTSAKVGAAGTANAAAVLELQSTTKGLLMPRMTTTQRDAIASPLAGLLIFNSTTNRFEGYVATTGWVALHGWGT